jgi:hypothetical protein
MMALASSWLLSTLVLSLLFMPIGIFGNRRDAYIQRGNSRIGVRDVHVIIGATLLSPFLSSLPSFVW